MWMPKITNDSVHFILLACRALLLDTRRLFLRESARPAAAAQFGHTDSAVYFGTAVA